jgi:predicted enzyme related to lactoylglutathione lyase
LHHSAGTFCFAELHTPAPSSSAAFYGELFGWSLRQISDSYWMFCSGNSDVVGMRRADDHRWIACVRVDRVDSTIARAQALNMTALTPAVETPGIARTAVLRDQEGAVIGLWEPRGVEGTMLETGPGSLWWVELATGAMGPAQRRYASLFDFRSDRVRRLGRSRLCARRRAGMVARRAERRTHRGGPRSRRRTVPHRAAARTGVQLAAPRLRTEASAKTCRIGQDSLQAVDQQFE